MRIIYQDNAILKSISKGTGLTVLGKRLNQRLTELSVAEVLGDLVAHRPADIRSHGSNGDFCFSSRLTDDKRIVFKPLDCDDLGHVAESVSMEEIRAIELVKIANNDEL